jgi:deoxyhypusine monooxygenase
MFALRNICAQRDTGSGSEGDEAALALVSGMLSERSSALFRHEVAFVLGQLQRPSTVPGLVRALTDLHEHRMVRHEAAEVLYYSTYFQSILFLCFLLLFTA